MSISSPNKKDSKHAKRLRNGQFLNNGRAEDVAVAGRSLRVTATNGLHLVNNPYVRGKVGT